MSMTRIHPRLKRQMLRATDKDVKDISILVETATLDADDRSALNLYNLRVLPQGRNATGTVSANELEAIAALRCVVYIENGPMAH